MCACAALLLASSAAGLVTSLRQQRWSQAVALSSRGSLLRAQLSDSSWGAVQQEMLGSLGLSDPVDEVPAADEAAAAPPPPTPRKGDEPWGRWVNGEDAILIDLLLPDGARAKDIACEVARDGSMRVGLAQSELLYGQLALPVDRTELMWCIEDSDDGQRELCIELPLAPADPSNKVRVDRIFACLAISGEPVLALGLTQE